MGDLSRHFSRRDFYSKAKQPEANRYFKISLSLVGYLELARNHFNKRVEILKGYVSQEEAEKEGSFKKNWHTYGKAVQIQVQETDPIQVFQFFDAISEITGLGYDPEKKIVHLDLRDRDPVKYVVEGGIQVKLTPDLRQKYQLGAEPEPKDLKEVVPAKSLLEEE